MQRSHSLLFSHCSAAFDSSRLIGIEFDFPQLKQKPSRGPAASAGISMHHLAAADGASSTGDSTAGSAAVGAAMPVGLSGPPPLPLLEIVLGSGRVAGPPPAKAPSTPYPAHLPALQVSAAEPATGYHITMHAVAYIKHVMPEHALRPSLHMSHSFRADHSLHCLAEAGGAHHLVAAAGAGRGVRREHRPCASPEVRGCMYVTPRLAPCHS